MRIPLSWLKQYVDVELSARELADKLTFSGTEVEGIEQIGSTYENFVVGEVRTVEKHPNADKLSVCRVFDGIGDVQVVCGAPNVEAGGKYPFAKIGATMPDGSFTIKKTKLRGVESSGMLCAADELGQPGAHDGLLVLDRNLVAGTPLADVFGPPETVIEVEITPNRPDCLSMIGVAREVAAVTGRNLCWPKADVSTRATGVAAQVVVEDATACPRYTARMLTNVKIGPSPDWMKRRLEFAGIRSINNIVDITNYVMLECGHPLHAFDYELVRGARITVRHARAGEKMSTLDHVERELDSSMLVIADAERAVAVAGVMGGAGSEIRENTTTVLLEAAAFDANLVRATARKLGLSTESSYRFERGIDPATVEWASRRAAQLMCELAGATCDKNLIDVYPAPVTTRTVTFRFDHIRDRIGVSATDAEISGVFQSLELAPGPVSNDWNTVIVPTFRGDLRSEVDLVEEFARVWGLDKVPAPQPRALVDAGDDRRARAISRLRGQLAGLGFREIYNYSLVSEKLLDQFGVAAATRVVLPNPISADQSILRTSLAPQMVDTLGRNRAHQIEAASLFEIGRTWTVSSEGRREEERLCIGLMGPVGRPSLDRRRAVETGEMFAWAKGVLEAIADSARWTGWQLVSVSSPMLEPGLGVEIRIADRIVGALGVVRTTLRKEWRLTDPVAVLEIAVDPLLESYGQVKAYRDVPAFPSTQRDVAMVLDEKVRHEDILAVIRKAGPAELERIELFDIFMGDAIGKGRKSMAYALTYRSTTKTLTDEEANAFHAKVRTALREQIGAELREG